MVNVKDHTFWYRTVYCVRNILHRKINLEGLSIRYPLNKNIL